MSQTLLDGDVFVRGNLSAQTCKLPAGTVDDTAVVGAAGIQASKLQQQANRTYAQSFANNAAVDRQALYVVNGLTGTLQSFKVGATTAATGNATATITLRKNGTAILTASITLDSTTAAFVLKSAAGFTATALVAGDVLEVDVSAVNAGTGTLAKGLFAELVVREDAQ